MDVIASPFGRGVTAGDGEGRLGVKELPYSDKQTLCQRDVIAVSVLFVSGLALSGASRQGRVAAPSVCLAVAHILLAAAPTAPPCFRHWRRSSLLPPKGEPLACRSGLRWMREVSFVGSDSALLSGGGACSDAAARVSEARPFAYARAFGGQREVARPAKGSPSGGAGASAPERDYPLYLLCARPSLPSMMSVAAAAMSGQRSARALASSGGNLPSTQSAKS